MKGQEVELTWPENCCRPLPTAKGSLPVPTPRPVAILAPAAGQEARLTPNPCPGLGAWLEPPQESLKLHSCVLLLPGSLHRLKPPMPNLSHLTPA